MKIKYKVSIWDTDIKKIEVIKETDHTIWYNKRNLLHLDCFIEVSERKNTNENKHFDTFEEAKEYLIKKYSERIEQYKYQLELAEKKLESIKLLNQ